MHWIFTSHSMCTVLLGVLCVTVLMLSLTGEQALNVTELGHCTHLHGHVNYRLERDVSIQMHRRKLNSDGDPMKSREQRTNVDQLLWHPNLCSNDSDQPPSTFLWRISTRPPSYLFGTLHVAYIHVWPNVDPIVKEIFMQSDRVYFELDLTNPYTLEELRQCQLLPSGMQLTDILPVELVTRLKRYLEQFQQLLHDWIQPDRLGYTHILYETMIKDWHRKRPIWLLLLVNSLNRGELIDRGMPVLDVYLAQEAARMGKLRGAVEHVEDQCDPLNKVKNEQVAMALELTLDSLESTSRGTQSDARPDHMQPQTSGSELLSAYSPVSNRENLVGTYEFGSSRQHRTKLAQLPVSDKLANTQRHTEWFMHPVQQLVRQYNCGDLTSVLHNVPMSPMASVTGSKTTMEQSPKEQHTGLNKYTNPGNVLIPQSPINGSRRGQVESKTARNDNPENHTSPGSVHLSELESYLNDQLIVKRNARMAEKIIEKLEAAEKQNECAFFALGAAHFLGKQDTVIDHLVRAGYQITPIPRNLIRGEEPRKPVFNPRRASAAKHLSRNRRKQETDRELLSDPEVPEFRPRYVKFENHWIRIEDFKPKTYPSRLYRPSAQTINPKSHTANLMGQSTSVPSHQNKPSTISTNQFARCRIFHTGLLIIFECFVVYFPKIFDNI